MRKQKPKCYTHALMGIILTLIDQYIIPQTIAVVNTFFQYFYCFGADCALIYIIVKKCEKLCTFSTK